LSCSYRNTRKRKMEKEEVKLFTDIFEKEYIPDKRWFWNWSWKSFLGRSILGSLISCCILVILCFVYDLEAKNHNFIQVIAINFMGSFIIQIIKSIRWNFLYRYRYKIYAYWNFLYRYRYKIYAYSLLVGCVILFFSQLMILYDLLK